MTAAACCQRLLVACLLLVAAAVPAAAATFHVDAAVEASGDGRSWATAWRSFTDVDWAKVRPGDRLLVSGGRLGAVYRAPLLVGGGGDAGAPLVIGAATEVAHAGPVVIDGGGVEPVCVGVDGHDHVVLRGLTVTGCHEAGIRLRNATGLVAESNRVHALSRGFHVWRTTATVVRGNTVDTPSYITLQTDGIYSQDNVGNLYAANDIIIANNEPEGHDDGIQSFRDTALTIAGNRIEQRNLKTGNAQGIFIVDPEGPVTAVNNIVYGPHTRNSLLALLNRDEPRGWLLAYNNTLVGSQWGVIQLQNAMRSRMQNNLLATNLDGAAGITLDGTRPPGDAIDFNLYALPHGSPGYIVGQETLDWDGWQGLGYERHGLRADAGLADIAAGNFAPQTGAAAIDAGADCDWAPVDISGLPRPQGRGCDIGAQESPQPFSGKK